MSNQVAISLNQLMNGDVSSFNRENVVSILDTIARKQLALIDNSNDAFVHRYGAAHYDEDTTLIEQVCRLMWGVVPMGHEGEHHHKLVLQQIVRGTDPTGPSYWKQPKNYDQRVVEMSAIAVAMCDQAELYWHPLDTDEKNNLVAWLSSVECLELPCNNWRWFRVLILSALAKLGHRTGQDVLANDLTLIESFYLADGWYQDGANGVADYYNPFAFQLYALVYCRWHEYQGDLCRRLLARAIEFSKGYEAWFGNDGKQLAYGRSLNYRFAAAGFWAELARVDDDRVDVVLCRDIWTQTLSWWAGQSIWDTNAQLLPGFGYPNLLSTEFYTSSVSPMLALKAFNALNLPSEHPFWLHQPRELCLRLSPRWIADRHLVWRNGGCYMLTNAPAAGELRNCADKYNKCAYSSDHGLCVESERWIDQAWIGDNIFAVKHPETNQWFGINNQKESKRVGDSLITEWRPFEGCDIRMTQTLVGESEQREFVVECLQPLEFVLSGYAVDKWTPWFSHIDNHIARVESEQLFSELLIEQGPGTGSVYPCAPNTNLLYQHASVPVVRGALSLGRNHILLSVSAGRLTSFAK